MAATAADRSPTSSAARIGMLGAAACAALGLALSILGNTLPIEPGFTTAAAATCLRASWRPSSGGDGRGEVDVWHQRALLQVGTHARRAEALVRFDAALPALMTDLGLSEAQAEQALAHVAARNAALTTEEAAFLLILDAQVLVASLRNELLTTSKTLSNCTEIASDVSVCTDEVVLADRNARARRRRAMGLIVVSRAGAFERQALGLDATLFVQQPPSATRAADVDVAVGLATICWSAPGTATLRHAKSDDRLYTLFLDPAATGTLLANQTGGAGYDADCGGTNLEWLPSSTALPSTLFGSALALGVGDGATRAAQVCGREGAAPTPTTALACTASLEGCPDPTQRDMLPIEATARRALLLQHRSSSSDSGVVGTARITSASDATIYGSEDLILGASLRFVLVLVIAGIFVLRAYAGLSAIQLLAVGEEWVAQTEVTEEGDASGGGGIGVEGMLDVLLLASRVVIVAVTSEGRIGNGLGWLVWNDGVSVTVAALLLLLRLGTKTAVSFETILMFGGSGWQVSAMLGLLTASTSLPYYEDREVYTVLAVFGSLFLLVGQCLPRVCVAAGLSYAGRTGPTFSSGYRMLSTLAALGWAAIAFCTAVLTGSGVQAQLYLSARSLEQPMALYAIGLAVVLLSFGASLWTIHREADALA